jgi:hypothetical protein
MIRNSFNIVEALKLTASKVIILIDRLKWC